MKVWVVYCKSESCDTYGPFVYAKKPTEEKLNELAHSLDGSEDKEGPGRDGSWIHIEEFFETEVIE